MQNSKSSTERLFQRPGA